MGKYGREKRASHHRGPNVGYASGHHPEAPENGGFQAREYDVSIFTLKKKLKQMSDYM